MRTRQSPLDYSLSFGDLCCCKSDRIILERRPRLFDLVCDKRELVPEASCQGLFADQSQMEFGRRRITTVALLTPWAYAEWRPVKRTKAKLILEFLTTRMAFFHGNLLCSLEVNFGRG